MNGSVGRGRAAAGRVMARLIPRMLWLRRVPGVGTLLHKASRGVVPTGTLIPIRVSQGIAAGLSYRLDPRVAASVQRGELEPSLAQAFRDLATPGVVFYDLGANIGYYSLAVARLVGDQGRVVAFEADPDNASEIQRNADANSITNLRIVRAAVWSEAGEVSFEMNDPSLIPGRGLGGIASTPQFEGGRIVTVPAVTVDQIAREERPPDFMKCDVEGAEVEVFEGATDVLDRFRPTVICEMHTPANAELLRAQFEKRGYTWAWLDEMHVLAREH